MTGNGDSLERRVKRLESVVGTLLVFLAAHEIIGEEDYGKVIEELRGEIGGNELRDGHMAGDPERSATDRGARLESPGDRDRA